MQFDESSRFCYTLCRDLNLPLTVVRVLVSSARVLAKLLCTEDNYGRSQSKTRHECFICVGLYVDCRQSTWPEYSPNNSAHLLIYSQVVLMQVTNSRTLYFLLLSLLSSRSTFTGIRYRRKLYGTVMGFTLSRLRHILRMGHVYTVTLIRTLPPSRTLCRRSAASQFRDARSSSSVFLPKIFAVSTGSQV